LKGRRPDLLKKKPETKDEIKIEEARRILVGEPLKKRSTERVLGFEPCQKKGKGKSTQRTASRGESMV